MGAGVWVYQMGTVVLGIHQMSTVANNHFVTKVYFYFFLKY